MTVVKLIFAKAPDINVFRLSCNTEPGLLCVCCTVNLPLYTKYTPILSLYHMDKIIEMLWDQLPNFRGAVCIVLRYVFTAALSNNYILQNSAERTCT